MKTVFINFLEEVVNYEKHSADKYQLLAECGARVLFDIKEYRFLDCFDKNDLSHYLILVHNETEEISGILELELKDYYYLVALYVSNNRTTLMEILLAVGEKAISSLGFLIKINGDYGSEKVGEFKVAFAYGYKYIGVTDLTNNHQKISFILSKQ